MCFTRIGGCHFVGCQSHRYSLAVRETLSNYSTEIGKVKELMRILSYQTPTGQLRRLSKFTQRIANETHWSPVYYIVRSNK